THMPERTWGRWLARLYDALNPGGALVFTTSGDTAAKQRNLAVPKGTLYFKPETEQHDLDLADYGYTVVDEAFVRNQMSALPGAVLDKFLPGYCGRLQDAYIIRRP